MPACAKILGETALVDACLAGDPAAREQLAKDYDGVLRSYIRRRLGQTPDRHHLADDLTNNVWHGLADQDYQPLRAFDAAQGTLATYLHKLGLREVQRYSWRRRRWQQKREVALGGLDPLDPGNGDPLTELRREEFLDTLTPRLRTFTENYLLCPPVEGRPCPYSNQQIWTLRHQVRKQLQAFLSRDELLEAL